MVEHEHASEGYADLVDAEVMQRSQVEGAKMAKEVWARMMGDGGQLYEAIVENGPLLPEWVVERIGAERIQTATEVLLEIDILTAGEWAEIESLRMAHAGLIVLLTMAEIAREAQERPTKTE